jgi:hypothetical protein
MQLHAAAANPDCHCKNDTSDRSGRPDHPFIAGDGRSDIWCASVRVFDAAVEGLAASEDRGSSVRQ